VTNPTQINWTDPTTNVDGSPVTAGEIVGYEVGVRDTSAAGSAAGSYPFGAKAPGAAVSELISAIPKLPTGVSLAAAVRAVTGVNDASGNPITSAWSSEATFTIAPPPPVPNPPTQVAVS